MAGIQEATYAEYLLSEHWKRRRLERIRLALQAYPPSLRDTVRCNNCERFVWLGRIQVHHRTYENIGNEPLKDLAVLCEGCHAREHGLELPTWYEAAERYGMKAVTESFIRNYRQPKSRKIDSIMQEVLARLPAVDECEVATEDTNRKLLENLK